MEANTDDSGSDPSFVVSYYRYPIDIAGRTADQLRIMKQVAATDRDPFQPEATAEQITRAYNEIGR